MGFIEEAADLASSAYQKYLEKGNTKQNFKYAIIDAIRRDGWGTRKNIQRDAMRNAEPITVEPAIIESPKGLLSDISHHLKNIKGDERAIFILRHLWGFNESEIGYCFGVTESRISQRYKGIYKRIQKNLSSSSTIESGSTKETLQEMARMEPKKGGKISICETHTVETEESRQMESFNEASFDEWLT